MFDAQTDQVDTTFPMPWFGSAIVRDQLQLNDQAFTQLDRNYEQNWLNYNQLMHNLGDTLAPQQQQEFQDKISGDFQRRIDEAAGKILIDGGELQRFNQAYLQYRGFGGFKDPMVQSALNLSGDQIEIFEQCEDDWNSQIDTWSQMSILSPVVIRPLLAELHVQVEDQISSVLSWEQNRIWIRLIGEPFYFPPEVYLSGNSGVVSGAMANEVYDPAQLSDL